MGAHKSTVLYVCYTTCCQLRRQHRQPVHNSEVQHHWSPKRIVLLLSTLVPDQWADAISTPRHSHLSIYLRMPLQPRGIVINLYAVPVQHIRGLRTVKRVLPRECFVSFFAHWTFFRLNCSLHWMGEGVTPRCHCFTLLHVHSSDLSH